MQMLVCGCKRVLPIFEVRYYAIDFEGTPGACILRQTFSLFTKPLSSLSLSAKRVRNISQCECDILCQTRVQANKRRHRTPLSTSGDERTSASDESWKNPISLGLVVSHSNTMYTHTQHLITIYHQRFDFLSTCPTHRSHHINSPLPTKTPPPRSRSPHTRGAP